MHMDAESINYILSLCVGVCVLFALGVVQSIYVQFNLDITLVEKARHGWLVAGDTQLHNCRSS